VRAGYPRGPTGGASGSRIEEALEPYLHPHVLVSDELGYRSYAPDGANVLYRVVNDRYLNRKPRTHSCFACLWTDWPGRACRAGATPGLLPPVSPWLTARRPSKPR
jgi:hypothetical protein